MEFPDVPRLNEHAEGCPTKTGGRRMPPLKIPSPSHVPNPMSPPSSAPSQTTVEVYSVDEVVQWLRVEPDKKKALELAQKGLDKLGEPEKEEVSCVCFFIHVSFNSSGIICKEQPCKRRERVFK